MLLIFCQGSLITEEWTKTRVIMTSPVAGWKNVVYSKRSSIGFFVINQSNIKFVAFFIGQDSEFAFSSFLPKSKEKTKR